MARQARTPIERIWAKTEFSPSCWTWRGGVDKDGYGLISIKDRIRRAHRVVWESLTGDIPQGLNVLHKCDNPPCVRPDHLFLGTAGDNNRDRHYKGRDSRHGGTARGERNGTRVHPERVARGDQSGRRLHPEAYANARGDQHWTRQHPERLGGPGYGRSKLTAEQVREIRARYAAGGTSWPKLGREFGLSHVAIGKIVRGLTYRDV